MESVTTTGVIKALQTHCFHCESCTLGSVALDSHLCSVGRQLAHQLVLQLTDEHAQADWDEGRLSVPKICRDCGATISTLIELDRHDLVCHGPVTLVHSSDGVIYGEIRP